ncbi:MAG TPA: acyl-ACP--UDP-N-acetylglucosamine O-acyltransferase [Planctomycetaceae bacterium]|nr:acyl-ACP--UDP-N-acetylglucosamine O-acyltransferase [Planctomycetaceae bacterium]
MSIHATAVVDPEARIHPAANIGPHVVIDGPVTIGPDCVVSPFAVILGHTELGAGCRVHSHAVVGDLPQDRAFGGGVSFCRIGAGTIIREGATVHRGTAPESATIIGERCYLMTNSHVGHNCVLADDVTLISGALLGGYVQVGARALISGNAAVHQFVRIGELAMISGLAKIVQDVPPFCMTDRSGAVVGVNSVGLKRAGFTSIERAEIKEAFRILYRSQHSLRDVCETLARTFTTEAAGRILRFLEEGTKRGLTKGTLQRRAAA